MAPDPTTRRDPRLASPTRPVARRPVAGRAALTQAVPDRGRRRGRRRPAGAGAASAVAALLVAGVVLGGCGDDEGASGGDGDGTAGGEAAGSTTTGEGPDVTDDELAGATTAPDVTVAVVPDLTDGRITFELTLTNEGDDPIGAVDPAAGGDRLEPQGDGRFRVAYVRSTADASAGGEALPPLDGIVLVPGEPRDVAAAVLGQWDEPPSALVVCVEVVRTDVTDAGNGAATFPYRSPSEPPELACSDEVAVDG